MAMRKFVWHHVFKDLNRQYRFYSWKADMKKLRPMILKRIENRAKDYPIQAMIPVANDVLKARTFLIQGVSTLLKFFPIVTCKFCPEVYIGEEGHLIQTCHGFKRLAKNTTHEWINGSIKDLIVPVQSFHLQKMSQIVITHNQRFDFDRVPAVVELCSQAGADITCQNLQVIPEGENNGAAEAESLSSTDLSSIANRTIRAWETLRNGVEKLLLVYPAKVCKYCSEVHVGPSGHKARLCGVFKFESFRGSHLWKKAEVDDLVPPRIVWRRRPQDPPVLLNEGRDFYGHAPAVVDLCTKGGAIAPSKYYCMMKVQGLSGPVL